MKKILAFLALVLFFSLFFVWKEQYYHFTIPIELINSYEIPCTSIEIDGKKYQVEIDLGSKVALSLHQNVLEEVSKVACGVSRRIDFRGNKYETPLYLIPSVKSGDFLLKKLQAREESQVFAAKGSIIIGSKEEGCLGRIGRDFFEGKNIFMDFKHQSLVVCSRFSQIKREQSERDSFTSIPFEVTQDGILIEVETDLGIRKLVVDTGSSVTAIRSDGAEKSRVQNRRGLQFIKTEKFILGVDDFGSRELCLIEISSEFNKMDGVLGMDFLKSHEVFLDFSENCAYFAKAKL